MITTFWTGVFLLSPCLSATTLPVGVVGNVKGTAFENLAPRYNQQILATTAFPNADVYLFDPSSQEAAPPVLVATLLGVSGAYGISELGNATRTDIFYVAGGNYSLTTFEPVPDSYRLYEVNMRGFKVFQNGTVEQPPQVRLVTSLSKMTQPNGMTRYGDDILLIADSGQGAVFAVDLTDVASPNVSKIIQDPSMAPNSSASTFLKFGINGLRVSGNELFYCNSGYKRLHSIALETAGSNVPHAEGTAEIIAKNCICDDFDVDRDLGMLLVASPADAVLGVDIKTGNQTVLAGAFGNLTAGIPGASSAQIGNCGRTLYVTTNANGNASAPFGLQGLRSVDLLPLTTRKILAGTYGAE